MNLIQIYRLIFLIPILFISCGTGDDTEINDVVKPSFIEQEKECNPKEQPNYLGEITSNAIGIIKVGEILPDLSEFIEYEIQTVEQIVPQPDGGEKFKKVHHLYYNMTEVLYIEMDNSNIVSAITTFYPYYFLQNNCIKVGSQIESLYKKYNEIDAMLNFDDNMLYIIAYDLPGITFILTPDNILNQEKINKADGRTTLENINPKGVIMNILVKN